MYNNTFRKTHNAALTLCIMPCVMRWGGDISTGYQLLA